ncbi:hypothetical protein C7999DRAFT_34775 [Corynascus novoguineensis]|uniref:Uncharacterized protein n=1 Tax=Corynascus novoguineensis TaxID=1126955 RepID=A0AAN7CNH2_9PEZI|nr:hypothetical protein C7999DRAFT_34775 [Corynascus novoguineensis]
MSSRSGSEEKKPRRQQQVYESEGEESEDYQRQPQRKRNQGKRRGGQGPLDNLALDNVQNTAGGLVNSATGALGGVTGNAVQQQGQKDGGKSDTLRLRLDLNLDVEITLKAKIHGDLELALFRSEVMASTRQPASNWSGSPSPKKTETVDDELIDTEAKSESQSDRRHTPAQGNICANGDQEQPKSPAYVCPIPSIDSIPPVSPVSAGIQISPTDRPDIPPSVGALILGKSVDEDGDIVDDKTRQVLAHTAGDLPSMVGRKVSNLQGDILGDNGELLGYVADIEWPEARPPPASPPPRSLFDMMGRTTSSLMVDHAGNILDANGNVVGRFHDNNNPLHRKEKDEKEARERADKAQQQQQQHHEQQPSQSKDRQRLEVQDQRHRSPPSTPPQPLPLPEHSPEPERQSRDQERSESAAGDGQPRPRRTEEERRQNAEAWRKENPNESPSDIFLDVKSTREGIQLTIRIPTVFNGQQTTPHISFS